MNRIKCPEAAKEIWMVKSGHHTISFKSHDVQYLRGITHMMKAELKGRCDIPQCLSFRQPKVNDDASDKVKDLYMSSEDDVKCIEYALDKLKRAPVKVNASVNSFLNSVLKQVKIPDGFNASHLRSQIAAYMAKHVSFFQPRMADYLKQHKLTFEGYILGIAQATICCDIYMVGALSRMWNVSITIISPVYTSPWKLFHDSSKHNIVVLANGHSFGRQTHYSATQKSSSVAQKVGHDLQDANIKFIHGFIQGKKAASKIFELDETDAILKLHYSVSKKLHALKLQVEQSESVLNEIEEQLEELDIRKDDLNRFHADMDRRVEKSRKEKLLEEYGTSEADSDFEAMKTSGNPIPKITRRDIMGNEIFDEMQQKRKRSYSGDKSSKKRPTSTVVHDDGDANDLERESETIQCTGASPANDESDANDLEPESETIQCSDASPANDESNENDLEHETEPIQCSDSAPENDESNAKYSGESGETESDNSPDIAVEGELVTVVMEVSDGEENEASEATHETEAAQADEAIQATEAAQATEATQATQATEATQATKANQATKATKATQPSKAIPATGRLDRRATGPAPLKDRDPTKVYCPKCPKGFCHRKDMLRHVRKRCGKMEADFQCDHCSKKFKYEETLNDHISRFHTKVKAYKCQMCEASFYYGKELRSHIKESHY